MPGYNGPLVFGPGPRAASSPPGGGGCPRGEASPDRSWPWKSESGADLSATEVVKGSGLWDVQSALDLNVMERMNDSYVQSLLKMITKKAMKEQKSDQGRLQKHLTALTNDVHQLHIRLQSSENCFNQLQKDVDPLRSLRSELEIERGLRARSETDIRTSLHELRADVTEVGKALKDPTHEQRISDARELLAQLRAELSMHQDAAQQVKLLREDVREEQQQRQGAVAQLSQRQDALQKEINAAAENYTALQKHNEFQVAKLQSSWEKAEKDNGLFSRELSKVRKQVERRFEDARGETAQMCKEQLELLQNMVTLELSVQKEKLEQFFSTGRRFEADLMEKIGLELARVKETLTASFRTTTQEAVQEWAAEQRALQDSVNAALQTLEAQLPALRESHMEYLHGQVQVLAADVATEAARAAAEHQVELQLQAFLESSDSDAVKDCVRQLGSDMLHVQDRLGHLGQWLQWIRDFQPFAEKCLKSKLEERMTAAVERIERTPDLQKELELLARRVEGWDQHQRQQQHYWQQCEHMYEQWRRERQRM